MTNKDESFGGYDAGYNRVLPHPPEGFSIPMEKLIRHPESVEGFIKRYNNFYDRTVALGVYGPATCIAELFKVYYTTNYRYFQDIEKEPK